MKNNLEGNQRYMFNYKKKIPKKKTRIHTWISDQ